MAYTIKPGDTLSGLALSNKTDVATLQKLNPQITDPNKIYAGQSLNLPTLASPTNPIPTAGPVQLGPVKQEIPGVGTLTTLPKTPLPVAPTAPTDNIQGAMDRFGIQKAPELTAPNAPLPVPSTPAPQFGGTSTPTSPILDLYNNLQKQLDDLGTSIKTAGTQTPEAKQHAEALIKAKDALAKFDIGTLQRVEGFSGQGQGATLETVALRQDKERRISALERLSLGQDVNNLIAQVSLDEEQKKNLSEAATTQYNLAVKKVDLALGVAREMDNISEKHQTQARQFLLDMVTFGKGKTWEEFDSATQAQIIAATANSPITLNMVKNALANSSDKITYSIQDVGGRTIRFGFDDKGQQVSKTDLGTASNKVAEDVFQKALDALTQYKNAGYDKATVEEEIKKQNDGEIPLTAKDALDKLFPPTPQTEKKAHKGGWANPLNWFK